MKKQKFIILAVVAIVVLVATIVVLWAIRPTKSALKSTPASSLRIKEWAVSLPLTSAIADAYYTYDASSSETYISTKQLDVLLSHIDGCTSGLHGLYYKKTVNTPLTLVEQHPIEAMCAVPANDETAQIGTIQADIRAAAQKVTLN
jgi:heme/copper-type cytochrome/quinol oxidase subunit 2